MGKSIKKAKSERINALRKQYDAFLEEERKRKDRNNYIMEWLDKFQTSSTVSSVRFQERATRFHNIRLLQRPEHEQKNQYPSRLPNIKHPLSENLEETEILKAVSQKYILIPKITQEQYKNQYKYNVELFSNVKDESDWKSKYNILEELKQDEKEQKASRLYTEKIFKEDALVDISAKDKNVLHEVCKPLEEILQKQIVKDLPSSKANLKQNKMKSENDFCGNDTVTFDNKLDLKYDVPEQTTLCERLENNNCMEKSDIQLTEGELPSDHDETKLHSKIQKQHDSLKESKYNENSLNYDTLGNDSISEQVTAHSDLNNLRSSENVPEKFTTLEVSQHSNSSSTELSDIKVAVQLNNLTLNHQIGDNKVTNKEINYFEEHPADISDLEIDSKPQNSNLEIELRTPPISDNNVEDQAQIEEFETEQKDLFYSEEQNVNYTYDEEQVSGDAYKNNEQYSYYEVTKEDPGQYVTSINEYEESTEQYDPHYQQQFSSNTYEENPIETQYPIEDYAQNESGDQQQQFYENHGQQLTNLGTQQQQDENCVYEENQGNVENIFIQDYGQESVSQNEALEHIVERQLNVEDSITDGNETVVANTNEDNSAQEKLNTDLNVS